MVSIVAFQAVDRGSIPRQRSCFAGLRILKSIEFYVLYVVKSKPASIHISILCILVGGSPACQCFVANSLCFFLLTI